MSKADQKSVNKTFQNIVNLYEQHNYSSSLELIEKHRDSLCDSLNMKHQLQLNKMHASSAYHELIRLHEENPSSTELQNMLEHYKQMLEIHLKATEWNHLLETFSQMEGNSITFNNTKKLEPQKRFISSNILLSAVFILFLVGIIALSFLFLKTKLSNPSSPTVEQSSDESNDETVSDNKETPATKPTTAEATAGTTTQTPATAPTTTEATAQTPATAPTTTEATAQTPATAPTTTETTAQNDDYLLPSNTKILTKEDMATFDKSNINLAINEMFARYGYDFGKSGKYYEYFQTKSWYKIDSNVISAAQAEDKFSEIEHKNLNFLLNYKKGK